MIIWGTKVVMPFHTVLNSIIIFSFSYCQSTPLSFSKFTRGFRSTIMFKCITCSWHKHIKFCCCSISTSRHNIIHYKSSSSQRFSNIFALNTFERVMHSVCLWMYARISRSYFARYWLINLAYLIIEALWNLHPFIISHLLKTWTTI